MRYRNLDFISFKNSIEIWKKIKKKLYFSESSDRTIKSITSRYAIKSAIYSADSDVLINRYHVPLTVY